MASVSQPSQEKKQLRRAMIARRDALPAAERERLTRELLGRVVALPEYRGARSVLTTMSIGSEWSTREFLERAVADGKTIVLPRVSEPPRHLDIYAVEDLARDLVPGVWDIPEPDPARCRQLAIDAVDFALVPALAVDRDGYRLGYGAGFFDGLLAQRRLRPYCVTALPRDFVLERLPREPHDVAIDRVLSEAP